MKRALIEFKSTERISSLSAAKLTAFKKLTAEIPQSETYLFSQDSIEQKIDHIWCLPWFFGDIVYIQYLRVHNGSMFQKTMIV